MIHCVLHDPRDSVAVVVVEGVKAGTTLTVTPALAALVPLETVCVAVRCTHRVTVVGTVSAWHSGTYRVKQIVRSSRRGTQIVFTTHRSGVRPWTTSQAPGTQRRLPVHESHSQLPGPRTVRQNSRPGNTSDTN